MSALSAPVQSQRLVCIREPLESALSPEEAVLWLRGDRRPFALVGEWLATTAILGSEPLWVAPADADPFALLDWLPVLDGGPAVVGGGWVGWLGYGLGSLIEELPPPPPAPVAREPFSLAFYDHLVVHDGERWWFEALWSPQRSRWLDERRELWRQRLHTRPPAASRRAQLGEFRLAANGAGGHLSAVAQCRERIAAGEIYQANICLRLQASFAGDPVELFARALPAATPRFGALMDGAISLSPERFLRRDGRAVSTEPIKGTRPRGEGIDLLDELLDSAKDAAENVMIVDLMRNDLGRVCEYGSVAAAPPRPEPHAGVWHLVSTVSGRLRDGIGDGQLLRATFPPGSVTGAPKVQAMKVIGELEATRRELYTGSLAILSPIAGLECSVAIRTFELGAGQIWLGVGGGIVADSEPEAELAEALTKAAGPLAAIGGRLGSDARAADADRDGHAVRGGRASQQRRAGQDGLADQERRAGQERRARATRALERALAYGRRPDPAAGVFETVLVVDGKPVALAAHLKRLARSLSELYGVELNPDTEARARAAAAGHPQARGRLRLLAAPDGRITVELAPTNVASRAATAEPAVLMPYELPGGLGAHKWRDRRLLEALASHRPGTVPLLVDSDGCVLEAAHANVWVRDGNIFITPPADGRILPGITRARRLRELAERAHEQPLSLAQLAAAPQVLLSSSVSGWRPAHLAPLSTAG